MVAVPETVGVHWKTRSGDSPERPQLPASALVPLVVPLKVPPGAGMAVGLLQAPAPAGEVCPAGTRHTAAATGWQNASCPPPHPPATPPSVSPAVTGGGPPRARSRPVA